MKNKDMPAMPVVYDSMDVRPSFEGMTKREMFAMHAMHGILSNSGYSYDGFNGAAKMAIDAADALLAELDKVEE